MLTRSECNVLRGIAILGIFLHNYCHWLGPIVKENEYTYSQHNVDVLKQVLGAADANLPLHLVSFFGHYGVPIFLFLSAYGLVCKYESGKQPVPTRWNFIRYHYLKLFKMMIVGFVSFTVVDAVTPGRWHYTITQIIAQLGMVNNLLPDPDHQIWPGPYWFFGLMLQLYVVYRLLLCRRSWRITATLMVVCVALQLFMDPEGDLINRYRYNFMGGMLPFGLGLLYARYHNNIYNLFGGYWQTLVGCLLFALLCYLGSLSFISWAIVPIFICAGSICFVKWMQQWRSQWLQSSLWQTLEWVGDISAALFVCHPILRKVFIPISRHGDIYTGLLLYVIASVCVAWLFREVMKHIPNPKLK